MSRLLLRRALTGAAVVFGVLTLMFFLLRLAPGDPARLLVGPTATEAQVEAQRHALGLDRPAAAQYAAWLGRFVRGDWGPASRPGVQCAACWARHGRPRCDWWASRWC
jgi:ABC-type dipeptide/oligopeptide/nickel transport system permease component